MQFALRGDARIELAQAAGGGVARVGKGFWDGDPLDARTHVVKTFIDGAEVYSR